MYLGFPSNNAILWRSEEEEAPGIDIDQVYITYRLNHITIKEGGELAIETKKEFTSTLYEFVDELLDSLSCIPNPEKRFDIFTIKSKMSGILTKMKKETDILGMNVGHSREASALNRIHEYQQYLFDQFLNLISLYTDLHPYGEIMCNLNYE